MVVDPMPLSAADETTPKIIGGRFEVTGVLGRGGVGTVYRVRDRHDQRALALKRLTLGRGSRSTLSALFEREYATLSQLSHPRIIEVYEYGSEDDSLYYTMELLDGADLLAVSPLPYPRACRYLRDVATSLALLHARKLVHRDVSPRNVHLTQNDECKLLDFGALIPFGEPTSVIGTPPCIAPEALEGVGLDHRADLYALGCLAYYLLTGRHAYPASHIGQLPSYWAQPVASLSAAKPERGADDQPLPAIPKLLEELVTLLMRPDRTARPASATVVIDQLNAILGDETQDELGLAERHLASTPFVGRERELDDAARHIEQVQRGRGSSLLVSGSAGAGKSRLLRQISLAARLRRTCVIEIDASEHDRGYQAAQALCRELVRTAPAAQTIVPRYAPALQALLPELSVQGEATVAPRAEDEPLWHSRMQAALREFVLEVASVQPLVIVIDDVDSCEHASAVFFATLAQEARRLALCLIASASTEREPRDVPARDALRAASDAHTLEGLSEPALRGWFESLFGETSNLPRLSQAIQARSTGHPGRSLELLRALLHAGEVRFQQGTWILPLEPAQALATSSSEDSLRLRVTNLSAPARRLAHALSLYRGTLTPDMCRALAAGETDAEFRARLDELVHEDVLSWNQRVYAFANATMRAALEVEIEKPERTRLLKRNAEILLARDTPELSERLDAGLFLLEAGDPRAARILSDGAIDVCLGTVPYTACIEPLERALELCRSQRRGLPLVSLILAALATASFVVDRRLERHSRAFFESYHALLGLNIARKLRPYLGKHVSTFLGLGVAWVRYRMLPAYLRPCSFPLLVETFLSGAVCLSGTAAVCLNRKAIEEVTAAVEPLSVFGEHHECNFGYDFCRGASLITQERLGETHRHFLALEARLRRPGSFPRLSVTGRRLWLSGVNYIIGVFECFKGEPYALERAKELEATETDLNHLMAAQLRRQHHDFRGESDEAARAVRKIEACALRSGSAWQAETYSAILTNYCACLWNDLLTSKRALDETEAIAAEVPSLERYALSSKAVYMFARGKVNEGVALYERMFELEGERERIGWSASIGILASGHNQRGDAARARKMCEHALETMPAGDDAYLHLLLPLYMSYLDALGALGEHKDAQQRIDTLLERHKKHTSPFAVGALHECAARLAWQRGDRKAFSHHLKFVEDAFCPLGNPALIARYTALTGLGGTEGGVSAKIASMREVRAFDAALKPLQDRKLLAHHIFAWLMQRCDGFSGYLIAQDGTGGLSSLISTDNREPPPEAFEMVERSLVSLKTEEVTTHLPEPQISTHVERPALRRERQNAANEGFHLHLLSFVEGEQFHGEGALVLRGPLGKPPRIRYDFLQVAARHLQRLRPRASRPAPPPTAALA